MTPHDPPAVIDDERMKSDERPAFPARPGRESLFVYYPFRTVK